MFEEAGFWVREEGSEAGEASDRQSNRNLCNHVTCNRHLGKDLEA